MQETFKNVSIFLVFLASLLLWNEAQTYLRTHFDFAYGDTVLLCLWSTSVIVLFHLLYYFLGKTRESFIYLSTVATLVAVGALVYFDKLALS